MLVAGQRAEKNKFLVLQAWRVYPALVDINGSRDLVGLLKKFADHYGHDVVIGEKKGKFFLASDKPPPPVMNVEIKGKNQRVNVAWFRQFGRNGEATAALVVAIDLKKYFFDLDRMDQEILDSDGDYLGAPGDYLEAPLRRFD